MGAAWDRLSPRQKSWTMAATVALISVTAGYGLSQLGQDGAGTAESSGTSGAECEDVLYWYDPMVPGQHFDEPGKSPFMDMELVPKCAGEEATAGVQIDAGLVQNFGIRTAEAEYGLLEPEITVTGVLAYNERDVAIVQPRAGGYVQRTYGRAPDDVIGRGAPLADILVPEWGGAQQEYLAVLNSGDEELAQAMRERMRGELAPGELEALLGWLDTLPAPATSASPNDAALAEVEESRRAVFVLYELDREPMKEVAATLGIPLNTAYSSLRRARAEFRAAVERLGGL